MIKSIKSIKKWLQEFFLLPQNYKDIIIKKKTISLFQRYMFIICRHIHYFIFFYIAKKIITLMPKDNCKQKYICYMYFLVKLKILLKFKMSSLRKLYQKV